MLGCVWVRVGVFGDVWGCLGFFREFDGLIWVCLSFVVPTMSQRSVCGARVFPWGKPGVRRRLGVLPTLRGIVRDGVGLVVCLQVGSGLTNPNACWEGIAGF